MRFGGLAVGFAAVGFGCGTSPVPTDPVAALHESAIVIDGHSDTTPWFQDPEWEFTELHEDGHQDLPRMRAGGLDAQFWSIYLPETPGDGRAVKLALARIDAVHELARRHPEEIGLATTAAEVRRIVDDGRMASLMGLEGGHMIEDDLSILRTYRALGVRYMTLTHSFHTNWADSSGTSEVPEPVHDGLTPFGEDVVREMNRLGMLVDVSHVADATFWDTLAVTRAPVIASHSSVRAVADHPRNLTDDMLRALGENGGVAMINFDPGYIDPRAVEPLREFMLGIRPRIAALNEGLADDPIARRRAVRTLFREAQTERELPRAPLDVLLDHFDHAISVAGPDHVGLGADWDGVPSMPEGLEDVSQLPTLTRGLLARGHSEEVVRKVLGENVLRVLAIAESVSQREAVKRDGLSKF
jgi:membrane dipeptidase